MKLQWTGSDVLFATRLIGGIKFPTKKSKYIYFAFMTIFAKVADFFIQEHYVVSEHLINELKPLKLKKRISVLVDPPLYTKKYKKEKHRQFTVLYYRGIGSNQIFKDWVYGYDIFRTLKRRMNHLNYIIVDGSQDMSKIYPLVDFYVRPNRHDGEPRMIMECENNNIPYYWSKENPNISDIINKINVTL
ncbi:MAG: hypothetical protein OEY89_01390 [Gammaproteobacteria bacterium]|nr:hypothetical protein [Gammaproteobacteria bacterium]